MHLAEVLKYTTMFHWCLSSYWPVLELWVVHPLAEQFEKIFYCCVYFLYFFSLLNSSKQFHGNSSMKYFSRSCMFADISWCLLARDLGVLLWHFWLWSPDDSQSWLPSYFTVCSFMTFTGSWSSSVWLWSASGIRLQTCSITNYPSDFEIHNSGMDQYLNWT